MRQKRGSRTIDAATPRDSDLPIENEPWNANGPPSLEGEPCRVNRSAFTRGDDRSLGGCSAGRDVRVDRDLHATIELTSRIRAVRRDRLRFPAAGHTDAAAAHSLANQIVRCRPRPTFR